MLSLGLELGLPLGCCVYNLGNDCKGPRAIARVLYAGEVGQGLLEDGHGSRNPSRWLGILILHDFCKRLDCIRRKFLAQSAHLRVTLWATTWIAAYSFWNWSSFAWHWLFLPARPGPGILFNGHGHALSILPLHCELLGLRIFAASSTRE